MGLSVRCQVPIDTAYGREEGEEVGYTIDTCIIQTYVVIICAMNHSL